MKAWLVLENGSVFEGESFGAAGTVSGEVVYSVNMTGFQESLTDSAFSGKILMQTFPLVGNVGVNEENNTSDTVAAGLVVREYCDEPSNFREDGTLGEYMKKRGVVGIQGIDTRMLTHILRDNGGSMQGKIVDVEP